MRLKRKSTRVVFAVACLVSAAALLQTSFMPFARRVSAQTAAAANAREEAYRANNLGVALLEQFKPKEAAEEFRRALKLSPRLTLARTNLAIALFNVPDVDASRAEAEAAVAAAPETPQPHYVLGMIAKQQGRIDDALASFRRVLAADARDVGANVQMGQLLAQQRKYAEAVAAFRVALAEEPYNGTALYNLGTALLRSGAREEGQATMQRFQDLRASGAATVIGQNYLEQGRYAEALASTGAEADLVDKRAPAVVFKDVTAAVMPAVTVRDERGAWPVKSNFLEQSSGAIVLFDFDGDGRLDMLEAAGARQRLYRNEGARFADVTAQAGALAKEADGVVTAVVAGDYDNDEKPDLFVQRYGESTLYRNEGGGRFTDATAAAKIPKYPFLSESVAFVDYDHDGDLDLFVVGTNDPKSVLESEESMRKNPPNFLFTLIPVLPPAPNLLLRNNGDGTFSDQTLASGLSDGRDYHDTRPTPPSEAAKTAGSFKSTRGQFAVVPTDFDNRRDVDLLTAAKAGATLWRNMRDGTFRDVATEVGLGGEGLQMTTSVAAGDINKDGFTDFYFGGANKFALSDGRGRFQMKPGPVRPADARNKAGGGGAWNNASMLLDYDNDGLLDLLTAVTASDTDSVRVELRVWRNIGDGWTDVSDRVARGIMSEVGAIGTPRSRSRLLAAGDLDGDGDTDIVFGIPGGGLKVVRNEGGNRNRSLTVRLVGKVSNRSGIEAKVELRAGSLRQKVETYAASPAPAPSDVVFGLGSRSSADAVRVIWPSGVVQAETELPAARRGPTAALKVEELDRKPSSCPYLYTWNGSRFEFVTDFMGGGEMGAWAGPGQYNLPDPDEYVRIRGEQLREKDGRYELRVTNELEEVLFVDRLQLVAVSHPVGVEVFPNEGLGNPTGPGLKLYTTRAARPPLSAHDEQGRDVLARLIKLDRTYPDDFKLLPVRGYAAEHALTLDLGRDATLLLLTGWTDYAWSSDNVGASQRGLEMRPPSLQVKDREGKWQTVIESMGFPVGRPQTVTVDLKGKFLSESREVRIVTNMRVYWDQALVDDSGSGHDLRVERLEAAGATLRERGFSAEVTPDGREPYSYDYARVSLASPWKTFTGRYTRTGDVRELLLSADDMYVVSKPGDELALSFDAAQLGPLPAGWTRTFLLYADGFSKEMDINSASPHEVAPLPFHGMKRYPYAAPESYPQTEAHRNYLERYNTRVVASPLPGLLSSGR